MWIWGETGRDKCSLEGGGAQVQDLLSMQGEVFDSAASPDTPASTEGLIKLPQVKEENDVKEETGVDGSGEVP